jgi:hypothetical protein
VAGISIVSLTGLSSSITPSFSLLSLRLLSVRCKHQVTVDDDAYGEARTDGKCRLDIELTADELLAGIVERVLSAFAQDGCRYCRRVADSIDYRSASETRISAILKTFKVGAKHIGHGPGVGFDLCGGSRGFRELLADRAERRCDQVARQCTRRF